MCRTNGKDSYEACAITFQNCTACSVFSSGMTSHDGSPGGGMWEYGLDWAGPGQRQVADACECGNEP